MTDNTQRFELAEESVAAGKVAEAADFYRKILEEQPSHLAAAKALADIVESGQADGDAVLARRNAQKIEAESTYKVARSALTNARYDIAKRCYLKVLDLDAEHDDAIWGLAEACYGNDDIKEALRWYTTYLDRNPDDPEARHMVAAMGSGPKPMRASDEYVRETFDHFAEDFDQQLIKDLEYRGPELIHGLYRQVCPDAVKELDVLDLGCGTGLSGIDFHPHARRLVGVDLSPEMLKLARARKIYDELVEDEVSRYCRAYPAAFDLIIAADVFCYIGDLSETLAAAKMALRDGGYLVFSVEMQTKRGYSLTSSGRYAHKPAYVRRAAANAGLAEIKGVQDQLRTEYGVPVAGYITMLQKPLP